MKREFTACDLEYILFHPYFFLHKAAVPNFLSLGDHLALQCIRPTVNSSVFASDVNLYKQLVCMLKFFDVSYLGTFTEDVCVCHLSSRS
jgi:hypothetical protein